MAKKPVKKAAVKNRAAKKDKNVYTKKQPSPLAKKLASGKPTNQEQPRGAAKPAVAKKAVAKKAVAKAPAKKTATKKAPNKPIVRKKQAPTKGKK